MDTITRVTPERMVLAANQVAKEAQFWSWLRKIFQTTLDARARATGVGRVLRAIDEALEEGPDTFSRSDGRWQLTSDARSHEGAPDRSELVATASTVRIWDGEAPVNPELYVLGRRSDVREVAAAVLKRAGPLEKITLATVVAGRFGVDLENLDGRTDLSVLPPMANGAPSAQAIYAAHWMMEELDVEDRQTVRALVGSPGGTLDDIVVALGCSRYRAGILRDRAQARLRELAEMAGDVEQVATTLVLQWIGQEDPLRHLEDT